MRPRRALLHGMAALVGAASVSGAVLAFDRTAPAPQPEAPKPPRATSTPAPVERAPNRSTSRIVLAWAPGGLPAGTAAAVAETAGVEDVTIVGTRLEWLARSVGADGARVDAPTDGMAIPIEVAAIDPLTYANFVAPSEKQTVLSLNEGEVLLARTAARLRRVDRGAELTFGGGKLTVAGELSDVSAGGYEAVVAIGSARPTRSFLLARLEDDRGAGKVRRAIRNEVDPGTPVRIRTKGETPFLRYGDAVPPQMILKEAFGEFAAKPGPQGTLEIDPAWRKHNVRAFRVPILGRVVCHRLIAPQLRTAMRQLIAEGRSSTIDTAQYAGCYSPRYVNRDPASSISHHTWGIALDLNSVSNPFGVRGSQPKRLIEVMESHGFTWGGRWLLPDAMHFEWTTFETRP